MMESSSENESSYLDADMAEVKQEKEPSRDDQPTIDGAEISDKMDTDEVKPNDTTHANTDREEPVEEPNQEPMNKAPPVNCMEKIILIMDVSSEMGSTSLYQKKTMSFLRSLEKTLDIFLATKKILNPRHQFALALLQSDGVFWYQEFTNDEKIIGEITSQLEPEDPPEADKESVFSFDHIVEILSDHCELPELTDLTLPPPYIIRCILIYGRSNCTVQMSPEKREIFEKFKKSPYFFMDILYIHELPSTENKAEEIYNFFCDLDKEERGYVMEVSNNIQRLYENVAKLICHPLQRAVQNEAYFDLMPSVDAM